MFESSEHNIEDVDHASHMDGSNELDGEIVVSGKRRVASFSCLNELEEQDDKGAILQSTRLGSEDEIFIQEHEQSLSATDREGKYVPCKLSMVYWCQNIGIREVL